MANIYYNGISSTEYDGILTFSDVPNILQIKEDIYGTQTVIDLTPSGSWRSMVSANTQYALTMFGETITNVMSPTEARNKKFFIAENEEDTAISMVRALRNCGTIAANFIITIENVYAPNSTVRLTSRTIGDKLYNGWIDRRTIPSGVLQLEFTAGTADESDGKFLNSKIDVDVYEDSNYITTLEKNWYGNECAFDVTPVLATMTESKNENNGDIKSYTLNINKLAEDGTYATLGSISGLTTYGFMANQSQMYLPLNVQLLSNNKTTDRANTLYTYDSKIKYSVLARVGGSGGFSITYTIRNSSLESIYTTTVSYNTPFGGPVIKDIEYEIPQVYFNNAFYVDVEYLNDVIRYQIIRPLKASEYYQRVYWRGCYGQVNFFDFTGSRTETENIDNETYQKNYYDLYNTDVFQLNKVYSKKTVKTVKLKSHILSKEGSYLFNELKKSKCVWTVVNGVTYYIIIKTVEVVEDGSYNDLYTATIEYEYSFEP